MPAKPTSRSVVVALLRECGPLSAADVAEHLGWLRNRVNKTMGEARKRRPGLVFRIVRYELYPGRQGRETPIYAAEAGEDAKRPTFNQNRRLAQRRAYYWRNRAQISAKRYSKTSASNRWLGLVRIEDRKSFAQHVRLSA